MTGNLLDFNPDLFPNNKFSVAITGNRLLQEEDETTIFNVMSCLITNQNIESIYFGGAVGADTIALKSTLDIVCINKPQLIAVVPDTLVRQPKITHSVTKRADRLIELGQQITMSDGWRAFHVRNEYMVDHANIAVSFWNRQQKGGTYACITYFLNQGKDVHNVKIIGEDK